MTEHRWKYKASRSGARPDHPINGHRLGPLLGVQGMSWKTPEAFLYFFYEMDSKSISNSYGILATPCAQTREEAALAAIALRWPGAATERACAQRPKGRDHSR